MMKNNISRVASLCALLAGLASQANAAEMIKVQVVNEKKAPVTIELPLMPKRVVALNYSTVDILDKMGLGDRIVGMTKSGAVPAHLTKYAENKNIVNLGSMKEIDMEALMSLQPDVIFSSDRTVRNYEMFSMIAPTVASYVEYKAGFFEGFKANLKLHGKIFNQEDQVEQVIAGLTNRIANMKAKADDKSAILGLFTGGSLKVLGDKGRMSLITHDIGFNNLANDVNVNHGNNASYELFVKANPDYLFILDKDVAVGREGKSAVQLLDNELIKQMDAHKNDRIVFLQPGDTWYLTDGGIQALNLMLDNVESALAK